MITNFLELRFEDIAREIPLKCVCAGFESGHWRAVELSKYLIRDCLLDFALTQDERAATSSENAGRQLADAAEWLYKSERYKNRGEIGELLLHVILKQFYGTRDLITKIYFKDSPNDTVKGFDSVHVSGLGEELDLWLGEVKFYSEASRAITDVIKELEVHLDREYLKTEFVAITRKCVSDVPDQIMMKKLTDRNLSLDKIFQCLCIPVLLTYDSTIVSQFTEVSVAFQEKLKAEVIKLADSFQGKLPDLKARVFLCLMPLGEKEQLTKSVHEVVLACQMLN